MKPIKSLVLLSITAFVFGACSKKVETIHTTSTAEKESSHSNAYPSAAPSGRGKAEHDRVSERRSAAGDDMEYVDESASEPDNVRGGRNARLLKKQSQVENTSSDSHNP